MANPFNEQINYPPSSGGSSAWGDASTSGTLPVSGTVVGEVRYATDTKSFYAWNGAAWEIVGGNTSEDGGVY